MALLEITYKQALKVLLMHTDTSSHQQFLAAFEHFLHTGENETLTRYTSGNRRAAVLSVYRNGFIRASVAALESNFPSVRKLWGDEYFAQLASAYINASPPVDATLIGYGFSKPPTETESEAPPGFVEFLQQQNAGELTERYPYIPDVCRLDQAWLQALNERTDGVLTVNEVQALIAEGRDLSELPIGLVDSAQIVPLAFDLFELWGQLRFGELADDQKIELAALDNSVIFWQRESQVQAKPLSAAEAVFIQDFKQHADFEMATQQALNLDATFDISTFFAELLNAHLLKLQ